MLNEFRTLSSAVIQGTLSAEGVIYAPGGNSDLWNQNTGGDLSVLQSASGNWESTYTTVSSNSADWVTYSTDNISSANWVLDVDNLTDTGLPDGSGTKVPTQQSVKAYVDGIVTGINNLKGAYNADTDQPPLTAGAGVLQGDSYYVETAGLFYTSQVDNGDLIIATIDNAALAGDWIVVNRNIQDELIDRWNSTYTTVDAESANWDSTYTTVGTYSADWINSGAEVIIQPTTPAAGDSEEGNLWFDSSSGKLFVYYVDIDTEQWVDTSGGISDLDNVVTSPDTDANAGTTQVNEIIQITQAGYNSLATPAANVLYIIID